MIARLIADHVRRQAVLYQLAILLLAGVTFGLQHLGEGEIGRSLTLTLPFFAVLPAMTAFRTRAFRMLPVSGRDVWMARWLIGTVGAATWVTLANILGVTAAVIKGTPAVDGAAALLLTWPVVVFTYSGACIGLVALLGKSPYLATHFRRLRTRNWFVLTPLVVGMISGALAVVAMWTGLLVRALWPASWEGLWGTPGIAGVIAVILTIVGYRHHPASGLSSSRFVPRSGDRSRLSKGLAQLDRPFSGMSLFLWRNWVLGFVFGTFQLTVMLVLQTRRPASFTDTLMRVGSSFSDGIAFTYAGGMIPVLDSVWFPLLFIGLVNPLASTLRHLRALPIATTTLNALLLASPLSYVINLVGIFTILHLVVIGSLPHVDVGSCIMCVAMAALAHTVQLTLTGTFRTFFFWTVILAIVLVVGLASRVALPSSLHLLTQPGVIGTLMLITAAVLNHWLLTRRTSPYVSTIWPDDRAVVN